MRPACTDPVHKQPAQDGFMSRFITALLGVTFLIMTTSANATSNNEAGQTTSPVGPFVSISAGHFHTCAIRSNSKVQCWGRNAEGQSNPPDGRFRQISSGWKHSCGIDQSGRLVCWGCGGSSDSVSPDTSSACIPPAGPFLAVSSGDLWKSCAVNGVGKPLCWGGLNYAREPQ